MRPWVDGAHGWAYSSLRLAERLIASTAPAADARQQAVLDATLATLPAQGRWTVLLPLAQTPEGWVGAALAAPRRGQPARQLRWRYDTRTGLQFLDSAPADITTGRSAASASTTSTDTTDAAAP